MYTPEQRLAIGKELTVARPPNMSTPQLIADVRRQFGVHIYGTTIDRILNGGNLKRESHDRRNAATQDATISVLAAHFGVDITKHRPGHASAPHLYFPNSFAFSPFQQTFIYDCLKQPMLYKLYGACKKALNPDPNQRGKTDGHDEARLAVVEHALKLFQPRPRPKSAQAELPLAIAPAVAPATVAERTESTPVVSVKVSPSAPAAAAVTPGQAIGEFLDRTFNALRELETLGMPTTELRAAAVAKAVSMAGG